MTAYISIAPRRNSASAPATRALRAHAVPIPPACGGYDYRNHFGINVGRFAKMHCRESGTGLDSFSITCSASWRRAVWLLWCSGQPFGELCRRAIAASNSASSSAAFFFTSLRAAFLPLGSHRAARESAPSDRPESAPALQRIVSGVGMSAIMFWPNFRCCCNLSHHEKEGRMGRMAGIVQFSA